MTQELKNDVFYWVSIGWNYQIIHKMTFLKHGYSLTRSELKGLINELVSMNAVKQ